MKRRQTNKILVIETEGKGENSSIWIAIPCHTLAKAWQKLGIYKGRYLNSISYHSILIIIYLIYQSKKNISFGLFPCSSA